MASCLLHCCAAGGNRLTRVLCDSSSSCTLHSTNPSCSPKLQRYRDKPDVKFNRRQMSLVCALSFIGVIENAKAAQLPDDRANVKRLCDSSCEKELENVPMQTTESGLQYKDIVVGTGPSPPIGFQVAANYVAMLPTGEIFDNSLEKGSPYFFRVGTGSVVAGLDEGLLTMKVGGKRRLYVPGSLSFPKGVPASPGKPRVPPNSPLIFDVKLEYIPGLGD